MFLFGWRIVIPVFNDNDLRLELRCEVNPSSCSRALFYCSSCSISNLFAEQNIRIPYDMPSGINR
eukprot:scaffold21455_cov116-Cylindrotheca_fusiformis.AAC.1